MADRLLSPPLASRFWLTAFERRGGEVRLAEREPDWARPLAACRGVSAVPGEESETPHKWLNELFLRQHRGVPASGEAEFAGLAAWFRASEHARRLGAHASATAALTGDVGVSLREPRAGIDCGPGRFGGGRVAERVRGLRRASPAPAVPASGTTRHAADI